MGEIGGAAMSPARFGADGTYSVAGGGRAGRLEKFTPIVARHHVKWRNFVKKTYTRNRRESSPRANSLSFLNLKIWPESCLTECYRSRDAGPGHYPAQ